MTRQWMRAAAFLLSLAALLTGPAAAAACGGAGAGRSASGTLELFGETADAEQTGWAYGRMGGDTAAAAGLTGDGVRIAVIDTGVNPDYDFAPGTIADGWNFITESSDVSDLVGHGTAVCSLIAGLAENDAGADGLAPGVTIVPLVFYSLDGGGKVTGGTVAEAAAAIYAAVDRFDCDIINMSWGTEADSVTDDQKKLLADACAYARSRGAILIAAAGNDGTAVPIYPAALDTVIAVGAVDENLTAWSGSQISGDVLVCAPGVNVFPGYLRSGSSGTSFAAPLAAAAAAVALQAKPDLTQEDLAALFCLAAEDLGPPGFDDTYGWGLLRLDRLLDVLESRLCVLGVETEESVAVTLWTGVSGTLAAASYNDAGHMVRLTVIDLSAGAGSLKVPAGGLIRLYFLGNDGVPLTEPVRAG